MANTDNEKSTMFGWPPVANVRTIFSENRSAC